MNGADLRAQIERARELLRPSPVRQGHRPAWLMRYLRPLRDKYGSSYQPFHRLLNGEFNVSRWLDHWGSTRLELADGRPDVTKNVLFVSEPYDFNERMVADLERLCRRSAQLRRFSGKAFAIASFSESPFAWMARIRLITISSRSACSTRCCHVTSVTRDRTAINVRLVGS